MSSNKINTDVLIIGAGLAGIIAAISAAEAGAEVTLVSSGAICSGSSFYPGTWGFGLIGPENEEDEKDLADTIMRAGCQMPNRELVEVFVSHINESIAYLEQMGVPLKKADNPEEREFIPCFDYKCRSWHGIVKEEAKPVFLARLHALGVRLMPHTEVTELMRKTDVAAGGVIGATAVREGKYLVEFHSKNIIIASGGIGGLYRYRLNPGDVTGMGQYLALSVGAKLVNLEFMQMMPGFLSPAYGTVFNEKIFRYTESSAYGGWGEEERKELLELRSGHGPYSSRLKSGRVDEALTAAWAKDQDGVLIQYAPGLTANQPEFVRTYFEWLKREKHLTADDPVRVGIFAHASNGGIQIDSSGYTGIPGLYACGEATGGMHGADRLGGLSTANGLVFGRIAGKTAALESRGLENVESYNIESKAGESKAGESKAGESKADESEIHELKMQLSRTNLPEPRTEQHGKQQHGKQQHGEHQNQKHQNHKGQLNTIKEVRQELKNRMSANAMIGRSEMQCEEMLCWLSEQEKQWGQKNYAETVTAEEGLNLYLEHSRLKAELAVSSCMIKAIQLRRESRGSHHRDDYPLEDAALNCRCVADTHGVRMSTKS